MPRRITWIRYLTFMHHCCLLIHDYNYNELRVIFIFWLTPYFDPLEERHIDDTSIKNFMLLFNHTYKTPKCDRNISDTLSCALCAPLVVTLFGIICNWLNNYWKRLCIISWSINAKVWVIYQSRRLRQITQTWSLIKTWWIKFFFYCKFAKQSVEVRHFSLSSKHFENTTCAWMKGLETSQTLNLTW